MLAALRAGTPQFTFSPLVTPYEKLANSKRNEGISTRFLADASGYDSELDSVEERGAVEIRLVQTESGIVLPVKAQAGARRNGIAGEHDGMLKVSVTQAPEKGKANKALVKLIAQELGLKNSQVQLSSGATSSSKSFLISGIDFTDLNSRLQARLQS